MGARYRKIETMILRNARREAWEEQSRCCRYCFEPLAFVDATADHVKPRAKGGTNAGSNIVAACVACNVAKGSMNAQGFIAAIKHPRDGMPLSLWAAWSRRRMWLATHRACRNIRYAVGLDNNTPVGKAAAA